MTMKARRVVTKDLANRAARVARERREAEEALAAYPEPPLPAAPGLLAAIGHGLNPLEGTTPWERYGPFTLAAVYVLLILLLSFDVLADPGPVTTLLALLGPALGALIRHLGS